LVVTGWLLLGDVVIQNIDLCFDTFCNWVRLCMWSVGTCCRCYKVLQVSLRAAGASMSSYLLWHYWHSVLNFLIFQSLFVSNNLFITGEIFYLLEIPTPIPGDSVCWF